MQDTRVDSAYFEWDNYRDTTMGRYLFRHEYPFIKCFFEEMSRSRRILDVGSGSGRIALPLRAKGLNVVGLELDPAALTICRRQSASASLARGKAEKLPFADNSFDHVTAIQCFEYFTAASFLQECNRILTDNGLLIFDFVNRNNYKRALKKILGRAEEVAPVYNRRYQDVLTILNEHSFFVEAVKGYNWIPFHRTSDSALINIAALIEHGLLLNQLCKFSPWVLVAVRKNGVKNHS